MHLVDLDSFFSSDDFLEGNGQSLPALLLLVLEEVLESEVSEQARVKHIGRLAFDFSV